VDEKFSLSGAKKFLSRMLKEKMLPVQSKIAIFCRTKRIFFFRGGYKNRFEPFVIAQFSGTCLKQNLV